MIRIFLLLLLSLFSRIIFALEPVATVSFIRGSVAAVLEGKETRLLGKKNPIYSGDNIQTSAKSFVVIVFNDGSKITIRPSSRFSIEDYQAKNGKVMAKTALHKGGVRVDKEGSLKNEQSKLKIKTPLATINAQTAGYSVRLCQRDCNAGAKIDKDDVTNSSLVVIAKVIKINGRVQVKNAKRKRKKYSLALGDSLYEGDYLTTAPSSDAVLAFLDGGRVTVQEKTEYQINEYQYQTKDDKFIQTLIKGGLRVLTGKIGKLKKKSYKLHTPVATIGIRGTGFDLQYIYNCHKEEACFQKKEGLFSRVWQGRILQKNNKTEAILNTFKASYIADNQSAIVALSALPAYIVEKNAIRPDQVKINEKTLFKTTVSGEISDGLYVTVHGGTVELDSQQMTVNENEQAYVNSSGAVVKSDVPILLDQAHFPLPFQFNENDVQSSHHSLLENEFEFNKKAVYECVAE